MKTIPSEISFDALPFHLELKEDAVVFVTSDLQRMALLHRERYQSMDVMKFLDNLKKVVKNGTIVIPTYTDYLKNGDTFRYGKSKPSTGAVSNRVLKRDDFIRTTDPLHSVAVWGRDTDQVLQMNDESTFGVHSVFNFLREKNAVFLFFDVTIQQSFTFIHYVEERLDVPYRRFKKWHFKVEKDGETKNRKVLFHTRKFGVVSDVEELNKMFLETQTMQRFSYNGLYIDKITAEETEVGVHSFIHSKKYLYHFSWKAFIKDVARWMLHK